MQASVIGIYYNGMVLKQLPEWNNYAECSLNGAEDSLSAPRALRVR
jgi:hypothetical protein